MKTPTAATLSRVTSFDEILQPRRLQDDNAFYILDVVLRGRHACRPYSRHANEGRQVKTCHYREKIDVVTD